MSFPGHGPSRTESIGPAGLLVVKEIGEDYHEGLGLGAEAVTARGVPDRDG